jgi:ABC-type branched-subunit amino acid transport system ATPase component
MSAATASPTVSGASPAPLLETRGLTRRFGGFVAVDGVDFQLLPGARQAIIGPNGAGKTTFINLLTGVLAASSGQVRLDGHDVTKLGQDLRVKRGIARTFQINRLFRGLSVLENVYIAVSERVGAAPRMIRPAGKRRDVLDEAMALIEALRLGADAGRRVAELPYGRQRLVEIAIALGLKPRVLLLDEPMAGVPSAEGHIILDAIGRLPQEIGVLIIEHDMDVVFRFARHITVLVRGAVFAEGTPAEIKTNPDVRAVYLGQEGAHE